MTGEIGFDYQRLMELIRSRIVSGKYLTGTAIPSTSAWQRDGWSRDVVRDAIKRLQQEGILEGHGGKGVFVRATPEQAARRHADLETLSADISALREQVKDSPDELRTRVGRLEANLIDLYGKLGFEYPQDSTHDDTKAAARRERARG